MKYLRTLYVLEKCAKEERDGEALRRVADLVDTGRIRTITGEVLHGLDAATVRHGHELMEAARAVGKVALVY